MTTEADNPLPSWAEPSPIGPITGLDWSDAAVTARFDPYIAWVEWIGLAGRGVRHDDRLPFLIEFDGNVALLEDLHRDHLVVVPRAYREGSADLRFCTGYVRLADLHKLPPQVLRMQLGLAANSRPVDNAAWVSWVGEAVAQLQSPASSASPTAARGNRSIVAVIDDGCAFAHRHFREAARPNVSRLFGLWDQGRARVTDQRAPWAVPRGMGYGLELDAKAIRGLMQAASDETGHCNESACYDAADIDVPNPITGAYLHGTHVMDLAAGHPNPMQRSQNASQPRDNAGAAELLFVQLPSAAVCDSSGGWLSVYVLDGLRYVVDRTDASDRVVVNLSLAAQAGPHDGSSLLERAIDHLLTSERPRNLQIVVAAGNGYNEGGHACIELPAGGSQTLKWSVAEGDATDSFLEVWVPYSAQGQPPVDVRISVRAPGGAALFSPALRPGQVAAYGSSPERPCALALYATQAISGSGRSLFLVSLAPTRAAQGYSQAAPVGEWEVKLHNAGEAEATVHAWIERDGERRELWTGLGQPWVGKQSSFTAPNAEQRSTMGSLACGAKTVVVGAVDRSNPLIQASPFSASGPALPPSQRPGPDLSAPGSDSRRSGGGIVAAQGLGAATTSRSGTSMAAPIVARQVLNAMAASAEPLDREQVIAALLPMPLPAPDPRLGRGTIGRRETAPTTAPATSAATATPPPR
jgi:Subtilase family